MADEPRAEVGPLDNYVKPLMSKLLYFNTASLNEEFFKTRRNLIVSSLAAITFFYILQGARDISLSGFVVNGADKQKIRIFFTVCVAVEFLVFVMRTIPHLSDIVLSDARNGIIERREWAKKIKEKESNIEKKCSIRAKRVG